MNENVKNVTVFGVTHLTEKGSNTKQKTCKMKKKKNKYIFINEMEKEQKHKNKKTIGKSDSIERCTRSRKESKYNIDQVLHERMERHENSVLKMNICMFWISAAENKPYSLIILVVSKL